MIQIHHMLEQNLTKTEMEMLSFGGIRKETIRLLIQTTIITQSFTDVMIGSLPTRDKSGFFPELQESNRPTLTTPDFSLKKP